MAEIRFIPSTLIPKPATNSNKIVAKPAVIFIRNDKRTTFMAHPIISVVSGSNYSQPPTPLWVYNLFINPSSDIDIRISHETALDIGYLGERRFFRPVWASGRKPSLCR